MNTEENPNQLAQYRVVNTIKHSINHNLSVVYKIGKSETLFLLKEHEQLESYHQEKKILLIKEIYGDYLVGFGINSQWQQKNINFTMTKYSNIGSLYELGELIKTFPLSCVKFYMKQLLTSLKFIYERTKIPFKTLNHSDVLFQESYNLIPIGWSKLEGIKESELLYDCGEIMFYMITNSVPRVTKGKRFLTNKFWKTLQKSKAFNYFPKEKQMREEWISFLQKIIEEPTGHEQERTIDMMLSDNFFADTPSEENCLSEMKEVYIKKKVQLEEKEKEEFERTIRSNLNHYLGQNKNFIEPIVSYPRSILKNEEEHEFVAQTFEKIETKGYFVDKNEKNHRLKKESPQRGISTTATLTKPIKLLESMRSFLPPIHVSREERSVENEYPPSYEMIKFIENFIISKLNDTEFFNEMLFVIKSAKLTTPVKDLSNKYTMKVIFTIIEPDPKTGDSIEELLTLLFDFNLQKEDIIGRLVCNEIHDVLQMKMEKNFLLGIETEFQKKFYP